MSRLTCLIAAVLWGMALTPCLAQHPILSEFAADSKRLLSDELGEYPDWIEIYHPGPGFVDLGGYFLTDDANDLTKWSIPGPTIVAPGGFLVVFASDGNRVVQGRFYHANFRLSSGGEYLALVAPDGVTRVSEFAPRYVQQYEDISYGVSFAPAPNGVYGYFTTPTPGAPNGIAGAALQNPTSSPRVVSDLDDVNVTIDVHEAPGQQTQSVDLDYRVNFGTTATVAMRDDGLGGDLVAGDGTWTARLSNTLTLPGQMLRWKMQAHTNTGAISTWPTSPGLLSGPEYEGTVIRNPNTTSALPILEWFVANPTAARRETGTRCSLYYLDRFYDNVFVRLRGSSSAGWPKPSYKFDFDRGHHFLFDPAHPKVEEFNLNSTYSDKAFVRQVISYETVRDAGAASSIAFPMRVQQNGAFHSVAIFIEQPDEEYLTRNGLDPNGALYKMYNTLNSTSGVEKKTRLTEGNDDLDELVRVIADPSIRDPWLFDNIDVPAVLSYLAAIVVIHENDHLHKNYYLYRDSDGDREWRFLPWDKDLTLGRNFTRTGGVLNDGVYATTDPQSHPLIGDRQHPNFDLFWNRLVDAMHSNPRLRAMFLRRLRTVMDALLQPPGTPTASLHFENRIQTLRTELLPDTTLDRQRWGVPSWGNTTYDFLTDLSRLETLYLARRRQHLYVTHGAPNGIIPDAQSTNLVLRIGAIELESANHAEDYVTVVNANLEAVDLSGWKLDGQVRFTFEPGTVVLPGEAVHIAADLVAFRARSVSPKGGEQLLAVGPFTRTTRTDLELQNAQGQVIDVVSTMRYDLFTSGNGDLLLQVRNAPVGAMLWIPFSLDTAMPLGHGPVFGLGVDVLQQLGLPQGTAPFRVTADPFGRYVFQAPPGTLPPGVTLDSRAFAFVFSNLSFQWSPLHRITF
ncbi:MAG: CotH kinase family protein [Planctomycetes bacterium]|nr:CotH kinase family protein [Planctomycetota bacterium]